MTTERRTRPTSTNSNNSTSTESYSIGEAKREFDKPLSTKRKKAELKKHSNPRAEAKSDRQKLKRKRRENPTQVEISLNSLQQLARRDPHPSWTMRRQETNPSTIPANDFIKYFKADIKKISDDNDQRITRQICLYLNFIPQSLNKRHVIGDILNIFCLATKIPLHKKINVLNKMQVILENKALLLNNIAADSLLKKCLFDKISDFFERTLSTQQTAKLQNPEFYPQSFQSQSIQSHPQPPYALPSINYSTPQISPYNPPIYSSAHQNLTFFSTPYQQTSTNNPLQSPSSAPHREQINTRQTTTADSDQFKINNGRPT